MLTNATVIDNAICFISVNSIDQEKKIESKGNDPYLWKK